MRFAFETVAATISAPVGDHQCQNQRIQFQTSNDSFRREALANELKATQYWIISKVSGSEYRDTGDSNFDQATVASVFPVHTIDIWRATANHTDYCYTSKSPANATIARVLDGCMPRENSGTREFGAESLTSSAGVEIQDPGKPALKHSLEDPSFPKRAVLASSSRSCPVLAAIWECEPAFHKGLAIWGRTFIRARFAAGSWTQLALTRHKAAAKLVGSVGGADQC
ncbi:hypothetical protein F5146DRAFT_1004999 [Armillaria mellea]|nr:hypothetical protein F5146DRAFT_1004999 [Armillaria mellea]